MQLQVEFDFTEWSQFIEEIQANLTPEYLLQDAPQIMKEDIAEQFLSQGDPAWTPLSDMRWRIRHKKDPSNMLILIDSGALLSSWIDEGAAMHVGYIDSESVTVGTDMTKAAILHGGGTNEKGYSVPARPISMRENMLELVADSVVKRLMEITI